MTTVTSESDLPSWREPLHEVTERLRCADLWVLRFNASWMRSSSLCLNTAAGKYWIYGIVANLVSFRAQLLLPVPDNPLELLNALHHLGHGARAVDQLADLRVRELVRGDERDQADRLSRALASPPCDVMASQTMAHGAGEAVVSEGSERYGQAERQARYQERERERERERAGGSTVSASQRDREAPVYSPPTRPGARISKSAASGHLEGRRPETLNSHGGDVSVENTFVQSESGLRERNLVM